MLHESCAASSILRPVKSRCALAGVVSLSRCKIVITGQLHPRRPSIPLKFNGCVVLLPSWACGMSKVCLSPGLGSKPEFRKLESYTLPEKPEQPHSSADLKCELQLRRLRRCASHSAAEKATAEQRTPKEYYRAYTAYRVYGLLADRAL